MGVVCVGPVVIRCYLSLLPFNQIIIIQMRSDMAEEMDVDAMLEAPYIKQEPEDGQPHLNSQDAAKIRENGHTSTKDSRERDSHRDREKDRDRDRDRDSHRDRD